MATPNYEHIRSPAALQEFCRESAGARFIGFDTEFVSENRYRPELCLLQVNVDGRLAIIDTLAIADIGPFWELLVQGDHVTVAHAAREEFLFCYRACQRRPAHLFDVQLAAGMVGLEYPTSYANLVSRLLRQKLDKGETRTDWKRRPLTDRQLAYALSDVEHLEGLYRKLDGRLQTMDRQPWFDAEMEACQESLERAEVEPQWQRVSGISNLNRRALGIIRELWLARDEEAALKNRAPRRVLPDDLLVELAKRGTADVNRLKAIRGFDSRVSRSMVKPIAAAIEKANSLPEDALPERLPRDKSVNLGLLGQFLTTALNVVCREQQISPAIVGTAKDVRSLAAWKLGMIELSEQPELTRSWRAEIVGQLIQQVLDGQVAIRVGDPRSDNPLTLEYLHQKAPESHR